VIVPAKLSTARLTMRKFQPSDAKDIFGRWGCDMEVTRYVSWKTVEKVEETEDFLRMCEKDWNSGTAFNFMIELNGHSGPIGAFALRPSGCKVEMGYALSREFWGKGIISEATEAMIELCFQSPEIFRVWAYCDYENLGSMKVMEKVGMQREGLLHSWAIHPNISKVARDCWVYSITRK